MIEEIRRGILDETNVILDKNRGKVARDLSAWFLSGRVKKKNVEDAVVKAYIEKITSMAMEMKFIHRDDKLVLVSTGQSEHTMRELRYGNTWFIGVEDLEHVVMTSL